jgi:hypothetical protein
VRRAPTRTRIPFGRVAREAPYGGKAGMCQPSIRAPIPAVPENAQIAAGELRAV